MSRPPEGRAGLRGCAVPRDTNSFTQIPASPNVELVNGSLVNWDNDFYIFKPFQVGRREGEGAAALNFIDQLAADRVRVINIPGTTVAVIYKGRLVYSKAFGFAKVGKNIAMLPHRRSPTRGRAVLWLLLPLMKNLAWGP